jgi:flagellar hook-associated protein 2
MTVPLFNIGGLVSGLDTDSIIKSILDVEKIPIQQLQARISAHQVEDNAWQAINTRYSAVRTALNALDSRADIAGFAQASASNPDAVRVTATGATTTGSVSFTVDQLAANHQLASASVFSGSDAAVGSGGFTITVAGTDHTITTSATTTLSELAQQINALGIGVTATAVSVDGTDYKLLLAADATGTANTFTTSGTVAALGTMDIIQQGADAEITLGSGATALTLSRSSNTITDVLDGVTIELTGTTASAVTVSTARDVDAAMGAITGLIDEINSTIDTIAGYAAYNADSQTGGPLAGNSTARALAFDLRAAISSVVNSNSTAYPVASSVGISLTREGTFEVDESELRSALEADFDSVVDLLVEGGSAADSRLSFTAASDDTVEGDYAVVITQAATRAAATSGAYSAPAADSTFQIIVDGNSVDISVTSGQGIAAVVSIINAALQAAGTSEVSAVAVNIAGTDYITLTHSSYGSGASFEVVGDPFGLAGTHTGTDVAGTIGGEAATGSGQSLTATAGDPTGLIVRVSASDADVSGAGGSLALGSINYARGIFGSLDLTIGLAEGSDGRIQRARDVASSQIDLINDRIEVLQDRLDRREASLVRQYAALETAMSSLQTQSSWLASQLASLNGGGQS